MSRPVKHGENDNDRHAAGCVNRQRTEVLYGGRRVCPFSTERNRNTQSPLLWVQHEIRLRAPTNVLLAVLKNWQIIPFYTLGGLGPATTHQSSWNFRC